MDLLNTIKKASVEAVNASNPSDVTTGVVISTSPISIRLNQLITLGSDFLIVADHLKRRTVKIKIDDDIKDAVVYSELKSGETVILVKQAGGQKYFVVGRI